MTEPQTPTPPELPRPVLPVIEYPTRSAGNADASRALVFGLLVFVPFVAGILAIRYGRRGLAVLEADPRAGGEAKSRAGIVLGVASVVVWAIAVLALPPAVMRARQQSMRVQCMAQLRQIGAGLMIYANQNRGFLPAKLDDAIGAQFIPAQDLICPAADGDPSKPPASSGAYGNYGYVYLGAGWRFNTVKSPTTTPLVFEPPTNHADRAVNVLFFDGHVEALQGAAAQAVLTLVPGVAPTTASASRPAAQPTTVGTGQ